MFITVVLLLITGCGPRGLTSYSEAIGEYIFPTPSGDVEVIFLNSNATYSQESYTNKSSFASASPQYTNSGTWTYDHSRLLFRKWQGFSTYPNPEMRLNPPVNYSLSQAIWKAPTGKCEAIISFSEAFHYSFLRVTNQDDGVNIINKMHGTQR